MTRKEYSILGYNITKEVPSSTEEYNALAPKRENAVLEDAVANTMYRAVHPRIRDPFVDEIETLTGIQRINSGTEDEPKWESEKKYHDRALAQHAANTGKSPESVRAEWQSIIQKHADAAKFDPAETVREGGSGPKIGKNDLKFAKELFDNRADKVDAVVAFLSSKLNRVITLGDDKEANVKLVASAYADHRRAEAAKVEAEQKAAMGL